VSISLDEHNLVEGLHHGARVLDIEIGGKKETVMFKAIQYDHLGKDIIHADLIRVNVSEKVKVNIPIELKGIAQGTHEGGIIEEHLDRLEVECKVSDIIESIMVNVKEIEVGDAVHAGEIELPAGMVLVTNPETVVLTCHLVAAAKTTEELEEEAPAEPEIVGEAKEGEAAEGEESSK
jgi:large subunit ribosomal protein L25